MYLSNSSIITKFMATLSLESIYNVSKCDDDCDLQLFQSTSEHDVNKSLKRAVDLINNMVELNYITNEDNPLRFTSAGIEHMKRNYHKFINDIQFADTNLGPCKGLMEQMEGIAGFKFEPVGISQGEKFMRQNALIHLGDEDDTVDYNNIQFKQKAEDDVIWPTEGIEDIE